MKWVKIVCILFVIFVIAFLGLVIWASVDNVNKLNQITDGYVIDKIYNEPYSYIVMQQAGNIKIPITTFLFIYFSIPSCIINFAINFY